MSWAQAGEVTIAEPASELTASFHPEAGMLCSSLMRGERQLLAENAGVQAYAERGKTMGIPLLYPWANRLGGFSYSAAGRHVELPREGGLLPRDARGLPIHGVLPGRMRWDLTESAESSLRAELRWSDSDPDRFAIFPFEHEVEYRAGLAGGRLRVAVTVTAGAGPVPVSFGFHPYLVPPAAARASWLVELPAMRRLALDARQIPVGAGESVPAERFKLGGREFDDGFDDVDETARFAVSGGESELSLEFVEGYRCAQVYAPAGRDLICFEPMTAPADALRSGARLAILAPGQRRTASFALAVGVLH
jgi:aldose 1-epimerase